jgi:hypothetical protein
MSIMLALIVIQAVVVVGACGSVLLTGMTLWRSMDSFERRLTRMDSVLSQIEGREYTNKVS